ncbi:MAG: tetratricopeptide repeat protein [Halopseudomonas sp.]|uniref:tetratricopeptide repeat protein n=1 Tax=Halopseudomonas sp. TaxID=2901191 RepID=UPI0030015D54
MSGTPVLKTSDLIDKINELSERGGPSEFELHRLKLEIESVKGVNIYAYHMLMGMFYAMKGDYDLSIGSHEKSLAGGDAIYYLNYAYALRHLDDHLKSLEVLLEGFRRDLGTFQTFDDVCSGMIHAVDFSEFDNVVEAFKRANPEVDVEQARNYLGAISMRDALKKLELSLDDFRTAKGFVDQLLKKQGISIHWLSQSLRNFGDEQYFSFRLTSKDLSPQTVAETNCLIADVLADSGVPGWDKMIFTVATQSTGNVVSAV